MLQSVPAGGDAYIVKRVLMDKSDDEAVTMLGNCVGAMNSGGRGGECWSSILCFLQPPNPTPIGLRTCSCSSSREAAVGPR
jgi:hypothetical protein